MRKRARLVVGILLAVIGLNVVLALINTTTGGRPGGPRSSSYATGHDGLAAYHDLLDRTGHPVARLRSLAGDSDVDPSSTIVVLDPRDVSSGERRALRRFVDAGGRLVAGGRDPGDWLAGIVDAVPRWRSGGPESAGTLAAAPETAGVRSVRTAGDGTWETGDGRARAVLGGAGRSVVSVVQQGRGRVVLIADASPLQNGLLGDADDAALGLAVAGGEGRPVAFLETVHGYGRARGLAALPWRWRIALGGLLLAGLAWVASRARRLGPPEDEARALPPPRRDYVDAVAAALARARAEADTSARVRAAARERVARRAGLGADPDAAAVARAAERLGLDPGEVAALSDDDGDLLEAGRALAAAGRPPA
jgi:hypothetical protein